MIKDYMLQLSSEDLQLLKENSKFYFKEDILPGTIIYKNEYEDYYGKHQIPDSFKHTCKVLLSLGVVGNYKIVNDIRMLGGPFIVVENVNFYKLDLLEKILYEKNKINNQELIDIIINILISEGVSVDSLVNWINFKNDNLIFNSIEIFIYALSIENPEMLNIIVTYLNGKYGDKYSKILNQYINIEIIGEGIKYNYNNKGIYWNNKYIKLDRQDKKPNKQEVFVLTLLENKGKKCNYETFKKKYTEKEVKIYIKKGDGISDFLNDTYNNLKGNKSLKFIFPYIEKITGEGYMIN